MTDRAVLVFEGHAKRNYIHIRDVAAVFLHAMKNFESMGGRPYNVGLDDANLSKMELCAVIQKHLPKFVYMEAPIGEDPDKRDYIVSNARIAWSRSLKRNSPPASGRNRLGPVCCTTAGLPLAR